MTFEVVSTKNAENQLASIWLAAADRKAVTRSSYRLERLLRKSPATQGKVVFDTVRELTVGCLGAEFEVVEDDLRVFAYYMSGTPTLVAPNPPAINNPTC